VELPSNSPNSPHLLTVLFNDSVDLAQGSVNGSGVRWMITSVPWSLERLLTRLFTLGNVELTTSNVLT
jgi:hypothetical protein